jgi:3-hydroxyisobutyrate dehydrogenase-like beta-hydroxyacid dehydrogenase
MGAAMVHKLVEADHSVTVWNRSREVAEALGASCQITIAATPAEAVGRAEIILCSLANGDVTRSVLLADETTVALPGGALVCDLGTSGVETAKALDRALSAAGVRFVDAPVSGSVATIAAAQLLVMASGEAEDVEAARPVLSAFAKRVVYVGEAGAGQVMKLAVNLVVHSLNSALSEALALAINAGVTADAAYDIFSESVVAAPFVLYKREAFLDPDAPVAMTLALVLKDLGLITAFADEVRSPADTAKAVRDEVARACERGFADRDMARLSEFLRESAAGK